MLRNAVHNSDAMHSGTVNASSRQQAQRCLPEHYHTNSLATNPRCAESKSFVQGPWHVVGMHALHALSTRLIIASTNS
jgi:hypothetical protein